MAHLERVLVEVLALSSEVHHVAVCFEGLGEFLCHIAWIPDLNDITKGEIDSKPEREIQLMSSRYHSSFTDLSASDSLRLGSGHLSLILGVIDLLIRTFSFDISRVDGI